MQALTPVFNPITITQCNASTAGPTSASWRHRQGTGQVRATPEAVAYAVLATIARTCGSSESESGLHPSQLGAATMTQPHGWHAQAQCNRTKPYKFI
jgi:hypothetical protein